MVRFGIVALMALGLVACGPQTSPVEGKWGWFTQAACEGDRDAIEFAGNTFFHRREGEIFVTGQDVVYQQFEADGATRVTSTYVVVGENTSRTISLTFEITDGSQLIFRGSTIDGQSPAAAAQALGQPLFRCP